MEGREESKERERELKEQKKEWQSKFSKIKTRIYKEKAKQRVSLRGRDRK